jgi:hypothetical protein
MDEDGVGFLDEEPTITKDKGLQFFPIIMKQLLYQNGKQVFQLSVEDFQDS